YYRVNDGEFTTDIPTITNVGEYTLSWYLVGDENHNDIGSTESPIYIPMEGVTINIIVSSQIETTVDIDDFDFFDDVELTLDDDLIGNPTITYYYSTTEVDLSSKTIEQVKLLGTEIEYDEINTLPVGTYYFFAVIDDYKVDDTVQCTGTYTKTATQVVISTCYVEKPQLDESVFTYNGEVQTYDLQTSDLYTISNNAKTVAGSYIVTVTLNYKGNCLWKNTTSNEDLTFDFVINKATLTNETEDISLIYNGVNHANITEIESVIDIESDEEPTSKEYSFNGTNYVTAIPSGVVATDVGEYTVYYKYSYENYEDVMDSFTLTITPKDITGATVVYDESKVYNGGTQTFAVTSVTIDGLTATYAVTNNTEKDYNENGYTLTITANGNFTGTITKAFVITKLAVSEPTVSGTYKYNGEAQTVIVNGVESYMTTTDTLTQTNAGVYTITYVLDNNHKWAE
ncbi:MAG: hypothetical protein KBS91_01565, partial [Firmicutes bacterium]|nr:hypothetical protein [Candidatus Caballimonas caccae]